MAAGGFKEFVAGETLDQDEINDYLMQGMLVFAGTAARGSAIGTPVEGQFSYLSDSDAVEFYDGSAWTPLSSGLGAAVISGTTGSPTLGTVSSGGTTYNVYSFAGDGSIIVSDAGFAEVLVIGGGGSGGRSQVGNFTGGGGGAGGYLENNTAYLPAGTALVKVGAGGASAFHGTIGAASKLGDYYGVGGGFGASFDGSQNMPGMTGGSGGGSRDGGFGSKAGTEGQGFAGGNLAGGGASEAGATDGTGHGGDGKASSITGSSVTRAGGGGTTSGGNGGGGAAGVAGSANTGGGGGGAVITTNGASGGSGIVIVRVVV